MIFQSQFVAYINSVKAPAAIVTEVKREARARIIERLQVERADEPLTFDDLVSKVERAIIPA